MLGCWSCIADTRHSAVLLLYLATVCICHALKKYTPAPYTTTWSVCFVDVWVMLGSANCWLIVTKPQGSQKLMDYTTQYSKN